MSEKINKKPSLDDIDCRIANELITDSKQPLRKLAAKLKVSFVTVMNRIRRMERTGLLQKYTAKLDYEHAGFGVHVLIDVRIAKGKLFELEKKIARHPSIYAVYDTTGDFDAIIIGRFRSTRQMDQFLKKIQTYEFIERTKTRLILNTIKEDMMQL